MSCVSVPRTVKLVSVSEAGHYFPEGMSIVQNGTIDRRAASARRIRHGYGYPRPRRGQVAVGRSVCRAANCDSRAALMSSKLKIRRGN